MKKYFSYLIFLICLVGLDLSSKYLIKVQFENSNSEYLMRTSFLDIKDLCNSGVSFGILSSVNAKYVKILTFIVLSILLVYLYYTLRHEKIRIYFGIMIIAGAVANLIDRINNGCVYDFIDLHFYDYHWYVFNLADVYITIGAMLLILNAKKEL